MSKFLLLLLIRVGLGFVLETPDGCPKCYYDGNNVYYYECEQDNMIIGSCSSTKNPKENCGQVGFRDYTSYEYVECLSDPCYEPDGKDCSFYRKCLGDCDFSGLASQKCKDYLNHENRLSKLGQEWSSYVRLCLQQKLSGRKSCQKSEETFYSEHLTCYLDGPVSFCDLPIKDQVGIMYIASDMIFTKHVMDVYQSGIYLLNSCHKYFVLMIKINSGLLKRTSDVILLDEVNAYLVEQSQSQEFYILVSDSDQMKNIEQSVKDYLISREGEEIILKDLFKTGICQYYSNAPDQYESTHCYSISHSWGLINIVLFNILF